MESWLLLVGVTGIHTRLSRKNETVCSVGYVETQSSVCYYQHSQVPSKNRHSSLNVVREVSVNYDSMRTNFFSEYPTVKAIYIPRIRSAGAWGS